MHGVIGFGKFLKSRAKQSQAHNNYSSLLFQSATPSAEDALIECVTADNIDSEPEQKEIDSNGVSCYSSQSTQTKSNVWVAPDYSNYLEDVASMLEDPEESLMADFI